MNTPAHRRRMRAAAMGILFVFAALCFAPVLAFLLVSP